MHNPEKPANQSQLPLRWLKTVNAIAEMAAEAALAHRASGQALTETLSHFLAAQYAIALGVIAKQADGAPIDLKTLAALCSDVTALRRGDQNAAWLRLERHRLGIEYRRLRLASRDSHEKWKTNLDRAMEAFKRQLAHHPEAKPAFVAFAEQVREPSGTIPETSPQPENPTKSD